MSLKLKQAIRIDSHKIENALIRTSITHFSKSTGAGNSGVSDYYKTRLEKKLFNRFILFNMIYASKTQHGKNAKRLLQYFESDDFPDTELAHNTELGSKEFRKNFKLKDFSL